MTDYTIITTDSELRVEADYYAFDGEDDLYCYRDGDEGDGESVAHVPKRRFVAIFETDHGATDPDPHPHP